MLNTMATGTDPSRKEVKGQQSYWGGDSDPEHGNILLRGSGGGDGGEGGKGEKGAEVREEGEEKEWKVHGQKCVFILYMKNKKLLFIAWWFHF